MDFEQDFWNGATNTYCEETKQLLYLREMGFKHAQTWRTVNAYEGGGRSFIDIGGGPVSVLLKFENLSTAAKSVVVDPGVYPDWVSARYELAKINFWRFAGEVLHEEIKTPYDVALIYNCLQHVDDPEKIVANARSSAKALRMWEWIDLPPHEGHPHELKEAALNKWAGRKGRIYDCYGSYSCFGRAWVLDGG